MQGKLFNCRLLEPAAVAKPEIVTPLGILTFGAEFDGIVIGDLKPSSAYHLEPGGYLFNWTLDGIVAELLLCRPHVSLAEGMSVTDCWAGMWRLRATTAATSSNERPEFVCRWESGYQWTEGGPNSGEGLDAQTWENAETIVTVGTADCEWLSGHAQQGILPPRWADLLGWNYDGATGKIDPVTYLKDGIQVILPELNRGEMCQIHFVVAWSPSTGDEQADISTWYAADQRPKDILAGTACEN